jgi:hypothetical protein
LSIFAGATSRGNGQRPADTAAAVEVLTPKVTKTDATMVAATRIMLLRLEQPEQL